MIPTLKKKKSLLFAVVAALLHDAGAHDYEVQ